MVSTPDTPTGPAGHSAAEGQSRNGCLPLPPHCSVSGSSQLPGPQNQKQETVGRGKCLPVRTLHQMLYVHGLEQGWGTLFLPRTTWLFVMSFAS